MCLSMWLNFIWLCNNLKYRFGQILTVSMTKILLLLAKCNHIDVWNEVCS